MVRFGYVMFGGRIMMDLARARPDRRPRAVALTLVAGLLMALAGTAAPAASAAGSWVVQPSPNAAGTVPNVLFGDSCVGPSFCVAVGFSVAGGVTDQSLIEMWNGTSWSIAAPTISGEILDSVSCTSTTFCMAVSGGGAADGYPGPGEMEAVWNGLTWNKVAPAIPSDATAIDGLQGVSCTSPTACTAVGWYTPTGQHTRPNIETWNGSSWSVAASPNPNPSPSSGYSQLNAVSCAAATCEAVGSKNTGAFAERWNGSTWSLQAVPAAANALTAVSCPSTAFCEAVGSANPKAFAMAWNGSAWTTQAVPASKLGGAESWGVSCSTITTCVAVGEDYVSGTPGPGHTRMDGWNGTTWTSLAHPATIETVFGNRGLLAVSCDTAICTAVGDQVTSGNDSTLVESTTNAHPAEGFDLAGGDGGVFTFGTAFHGSLAGTPLSAPIVGIAYDTATGGYWLAGADGGVFALDAPFFGAATSLHLSQPIVGIAATPAGDGYDLVGKDGGVFTFGAAHFHGSVAGLPLAAPITGIAIDPATGGYWLSGGDGGVFALGAPFMGSATSLHLAKPVVGIASTPDGSGYDLAGGDGGVFTFGTAHFHGSAAIHPLPGPVVGIAIDSVTGGYWLAGSDGSVWAFDAPDLGSAATLPLAKPIVGIAAR